MSGLLALATAVLCVLAARRWRRTRVTEARRRAGAAQVPDLTDLVIVAVRAGHPPAAAIRLVTEWAPEPAATSLREVVARLDRGQRFAEALPHLRDALGVAADPLVDTLLAAERDGLAVVPALDLLADEARRQRRRQADAAARTLPIRLGFPLVCCTLPSFVLLTVVPVLAGTLSSLRIALP